VTASAGKILADRGIGPCALIKLYPQSRENSSCAKTTVAVSLLKRR
jgi:hypothetical protein